MNTPNTEFSILTPDLFLPFTTSVNTTGIHVVSKEWNHLCKCHVEFISKFCQRYSQSVQWIWPFSHLHCYQHSPSYRFFLVQILTTTSSNWTPWFRPVSLPVSGALQLSCVGLWEPIMCISSQVHVLWHYVGSLKLTIVVGFIPQKSANTNQSPPLPQRWLFNIYQHTIVQYPLAKTLSSV